MINWPLFNPTTSDARRCLRLTFLLTAIVIAGSSGKTAASDGVAADRPTVEVRPSSVILIGPRARQRLLVTLNPGVGSVADRSHSAGMSSADETVVVVRDGQLVPLKDGATSVRIEIDGQVVVIPVTVTDLNKPAPMTFHTEVLAALTKAGCNMGACHGSPAGKGGFRLSLRGYDPELDLTTLRTELFNRRTNVLEPDRSLLLQKPLMEVSHGGGRRLYRGDTAHTVLRGWIAEGLHQESAGTPHLERIEVYPRSRVLYDEESQQQLIVNGFFSDGSVRDVTALTEFDSSNPEIGEVATSGLVSREGRGEVTVLARYLDRMSTMQLSFLTNRPGFEWPNPPVSNEIDRLVFSKLQKMQIVPSPLCSDADFLRRATLDLAGRLPTVEEIESFSENSGDTKRSDLVERLLASDDYAMFWSMKWADLLRCNSKQLSRAGVHKFRTWLYRVVREDRPLSEFARELLTASGSTLESPAANFWRACRDETEATETTAQLFMGIRIQCAKCHNHPFERWTQDDYYGIAAAFCRVERKPGAVPDDEVVFVKDEGEVVQPRTDETMKVRLLLKGDVDVAADVDRRAVFADWLTASENPFFARSLANRIWGHLMGRGIVEPMDDFRDSNPPSNPDLLAHLAEELRANQFSAKHLLRTIMNSRVYQLRSDLNEFNRDDDQQFSHYTARMMTAEQLLDAICAATGVEEKFPGMPNGAHAVALVDPPKNHEFLQAFGQPVREIPCECGRPVDSNLAQALQLINGETVQMKIGDDDGNLNQWIESGRPDEDIIRLLHLNTLSRPPTPEETATSQAYIQSADDRSEALEDLFWAVVNSREFLFQR